MKLEPLTPRMNTNVLKYGAGSTKQPNGDINAVLSTVLCKRPTFGKH